MKANSAPKRRWHSAKEHDAQSESSCKKLENGSITNYADSSLCKLPALGVGTWAWGDEKWGYGRPDANYDDDTLQAAFNTAVSLGVNFFDTSEVYGGSHAEVVLGRCLHQSKQRCFVATKWHPRANASIFQRCYDDTVIDSMRRTLKASNKRLGVDCVDLFQLHSGTAYYGTLEEYADGLAAMVREGHARHVGVSNVGASQVRRIHSRLQASHGIQLFSNQVEFSLLEPGIAQDGTLEECKRLGVIVLAYCPLGMGRLTGKYSADNEPQFFGYGNKAHRYHGAYPWPQIEQVLETCREISKRRQVSISQVALNWCIAQGTVPIPGAKTASQAADNCGAFKWALDCDELERLNAVAVSAASPLESQKQQRQNSGKGKGRHNAGKGKGRGKEPSSKEPH